MAKHLKKKSNYRLFSTKAPPERLKTDTRESAGSIPDYSPDEVALPSTDMPDIGPKYVENGNPVDVEPEEVEPAPIVPQPAAGEQGIPDTEYDAAESVPEPPAPRRAEKKPSEKLKPRRGLYVSRRAGRRLMLVLVVLLAAAAIFIVALRGGNGGGGQPPLKDGYAFSPKSVEATKPDKYISSTAIMVNDAEVESYTASDALTINFGTGDRYTTAKGVLSFRGNNFRSSASYGTADVTSGKFTQSWSSNTGTLTDASGSTWSGSGWTGQPLLICWPDSTREKMTSMYDWARKQSGLVEAIYPTMDGKIYFSELSTGKATRDPMNLGFTFKGTGALDPRGYPILYIGSGVNSTAGKSRVFIINLIDCTVMYRFGYYEPFAQRDWNMWDASPLVDAKTDQLIYPGENGLLYIIHLNTLYDEAAGSLTVNPDNIVKWRYDGVRTTTYTYWTGFEASPVCWQGRIIMADNGGNLMCLNLNTLKLDWVCDVLDDTNCSPVLSLEDDGAYIYIGTSFHPGWRSETSAAVPVYKINAVTGEIVWEKDYTCTGDDGLCGGVQGTIALGKGTLSGLVFASVASTPNAKSGTLVALNAKTGEEVWSFATDAYSWSSPVDVYDGKGNGYLIYAASDGALYLLDGKTGKTLDTFDLGGAVEASPAVYDGWAVIGTRGSKIWGIKLG